MFADWSRPFDKLGHKVQWVRGDSIRRLFRRKLFSSIHFCQLGRRIRWVVRCHITLCFMRYRPGCTFDANISFRYLGQTTFLLSIKVAVLNFFNWLTWITCRIVFDWQSTVQYCTHVLSHVQDWPISLHWRSTFKEGKRERKRITNWHVFLFECNTDHYKPLTNVSFR